MPRFVATHRIVRELQFSQLHKETQQTNKSISLYCRSTISEIQSSDFQAVSIAVAEFLRIHSQH